MKLNQAKTRSASTRSIRTRSTSVSTNSRGQTEEDIQRENESGISHDLENPAHDDYHDKNDSERGEESHEDQTLEELEATAKASNAAARLLASRNTLLEKGMNILHSQGADMSIHCDDIDALNLSESELKTLMRRYTLQPQKSSLPGSSVPTVPPRLRLIGDLKRLTGHMISAADALAFQEASGTLGREDIEMNLRVDEEASFTIDSTLEAKA